MTSKAWPIFSSETPNGASGWGEAAANVGNPASPPPPPPTNPQARIRLTTIGDVAKEVKKLYRESRAGTLALSDATRLAYLLNMLAGIMTVSDLEQRLAAIEAAGKPNR